MSAYGVPDWPMRGAVAVLVIVFAILIAAMAHEALRDPCEPREICDHYETASGWDSIHGHSVTITVCTRSHFGPTSRCKQ